ncbi:MAG: 50S ribosomal protein L21 [Fibrobacter sp.]|jgi:large subunit ribosomal protein L21|nr:50S ribosomal protein L21 [Fibrobacter sp.]HON09496.1 50S ribosomal protein L21 [Chitinispirillaceae bacterium]
MYSIIEQGGAQFKVTEGATIRVPLIEAEKGAEITIDKVLLAADGDKIKIGTPVVEGASVTAKVLDHTKAKKVLVIKRKRRKDYRRKNGHRQQYTKLEIVSIKI